MVTLTYPFSVHPRTPLPTQVQQGISSGALEAQRQDGVHPSYIVRIDGGECFFKDYTIRREPLAMLAEWAAFRGARTSAALYYREPLSWSRVEPGIRAASEARALRQWSAIGITAPRVLRYDDIGIVLERIEGRPLDERVLDGTLTDAHVSNLAEALHTARDAALTIDDPSYLHNDPKLSNAIGTDDGRVYLIDPGLLHKNLSVRDLDAAFSLSYLIGLEALARAHNKDPSEDRAITDRLDALADAYLDGVDTGTRELIHAHAKPVTDRHIERMRSVPAEPFRRFARWLSYADADSMDRITTLID